MATTSFDTDVRHGGGSGALGVHGASRKIGKPAQRKPVIIYMVSPKIIHVEANEFMSLVQRLTGPDGRAAAGDDRRPSPPHGSAGTGRGAGKGGGGGARTVPVRVKARALNRRGQAVSVAAATTSPSAFLFHDLNPTLRGAALKGEAVASPPPSWLSYHGGDHFLSPGPVLDSPSGYLDIFGHLPSQ